MRWASESAPQAAGFGRGPAKLGSLVCVLVLGLPAGWVAAHSGHLRLTTGGKVKHQHTNTYRTFVDLPNGSELKTKFNEARAEWDDDTKVALPVTTLAGNAQIKVTRANTGDDGTATTWDASYHASNANIKFNSYYVDSYSATGKRARSCHVIGHVLGLEHFATPGADCMRQPAGGGPPSDPNVGQHSIETVNEFYGPNVSYSGSIDNDPMNLQWDKSYTISAAGSGHAIKKVRILVDGEVWHENTRTACEQSCEVLINDYKIDGHELTSGQHTIRVEAENQFGDVSQKSFDVAIEQLTGQLPQFTFQDFPISDASGLRVNVTNGNLMLRNQDVRIAGTELELVVDRYFNSLSGRETTLGRGWSLGTADGVKIAERANGDVEFFGPSGYKATFAKNGSDYDAPTGINAELTRQGTGDYTLELLESKEKYKFDDGRFDQHVTKNDQMLDFFYETSGSNSGRFQKVKDTQERDLTTTYDANGKLLTLKDAANREWTYDVQANRLESYTDATEDATYDYGYDSIGRLETITDPRTGGKAGTTKIVYDTARSHRVEKVIRAFDPNVSDPEVANFTTAFAYDTGRTSVCNDVGPDNDDLPSTDVVDPRGNMTVYCSDDMGRVEKVRDARGIETQSDFEGTTANVETYTSGTGQISKVEYGDGNQLTKILPAGGAATTLDYGSDSSSFQPEESTDDRGQSTGYAYDDSGNLTSLNPPADASDGAGVDRKIDLDWNTDDDNSQQGWDPDWKGTIESSEDGRNNKTTYEYDGAGNLTREKTPGPQGDTVYTYDQLARVTSVIDGRGEKRTMLYDDMGRVLRVTYVNDPGTTQDDVWTEYDYDEAGNLIARRDGGSGFSTAQEDTYDFDRRNQLTSEALRSGSSIEYAYDRSGNLTTLDDAGGTSTYTYNAINKVKTIKEPGSASPTTFTYRGEDDDQETENQLEHVEFANGVKQTYIYRGDSDRVRGIKAWLAGTSTDEPADLVNLEWDYDDPDEPAPTGSDGEQTSLRFKQTDHIATRTLNYTYDNKRRLTKANVPDTAGDDYDYSYDVSSNMLLKAKDPGATTRYILNEDNELRCSYTGAEVSTCPSDARDLDYDLNGNLTQIEDGLGFAYNERNQTTEITPDGQSPIALAYAESSQQERLSRGNTMFEDTILGFTTEAQGNPASQTTRLIRDDAGSPHGMRVSTSSTDQSYWFIRDSIGSVVAVTDESGQLAGRYRYSPYGELEQDTVTPDSPIRFQSQQFDAPTGLYKMGVRYYDPSFGRWTQKDPLNLFQDPRQGNRYSFVGGDPVNNTDPSGQILDGICGGGLLGAVCGCANPVDSYTLETTAYAGGLGFAVGYVASYEGNGSGLISSGVGLVSGGVAGTVGYSYGSVVGCATGLGDLIF